MMPRGAWRVRNLRVSQIPPERCTTSRGRSPSTIRSTRRYAVSQARFPRSPGLVAELSQLA